MLNSFIHGIYLIHTLITRAHTGAQFPQIQGEINNVNGERFLIGRINQNGSILI
jgi:hypothetical protein